jgi:hypothetical protein
MENRLLFALLALLFAAGAFADAYTWTDEDGVVHFSDRPHRNAEKIDLGETGKQRPEPTASSSPVRNNAPPPDLAPKYTGLDVTNPAAEETLWNIEAVLNVDLELTPSLMPGHQIRVYFDGMPRIVSSTNFQLQQVYRGTHNLQAEIINEIGTLLIRSRPIRFYVQQNTVR